MALTNGQQAALYYARKQRRTRSPSLVALGNLSVAVDASNDAAVGALKVANGKVSYTFSLTNDGGGAFKVGDDGNSIVVADSSLLAAGPTAIAAQAEDGDGNTLTVGVIINVIPS